MPESSFFDEKQAAAILKHGILGRYVRTFCSKTGGRSAGNRVVYLDGYAGQGAYDDGQPGSPILAARTAGSLAQVRNVLGIYIEKNKETAELLAENLALTNHNHQILRGELEECLAEALLLVQEDDPLFAFFDPFGLPISMDLIAKVMGHSCMREGYRQGPPTEVLVTLSYPGLRRNAGHLTSVSTNAGYVKGRETRLESLDEILGGAWWRSIWEGGSADRVALIASGYTDRLAERMSARGWYQVPVSRRWHGPTAYELLFFTQYPEEGIWYFNECVSLAVESFRAFCSRGQLDLDPVEVREQRWTSIIRTNIQETLQKRVGIHLGKEMSVVYGATLGYAREKHLRAAIKQLHQYGAIKHDGKGSLANAYVERS